MPALQREATSRVRVLDLALEAGPAAVLELVAELGLVAEREQVADDAAVVPAQQERVRAEAVEEAVRR